MKENNKITVIIPLEEYNEEVSYYFKKAVESIEKTGKTFEKDSLTVVIAGNKETTEKAVNVAEGILDGYTVESYVSEDTEFCTLVNGAVFACTTPYFSVLEFDDEFSKNAFANFNEYSSRNDASVYLNITKLVDANTDKDGERHLLGFGNELAWASSFSEEYGYIGKEEIGIYSGYVVDGGFVRTEDFISMKGLVKNYKLVCWYDYLSRLILDEKKIYVIPKNGCIHTVGRKGSYTDRFVSDEEMYSELENLYKEISDRHKKEE